MNQLKVRTFSGLGNQLFQYAAALYYAEHYGAQLELVIDPPEKAVSYGLPRPFLLSNFCITAAFRDITPAERRMLHPSRKLAPIVAVQNRLRRVQVFREVIEERYEFLSELPVQPWARTLWVHGYWQSSQMVSCVADQVRTQLAFRAEATGRNAQLQQQINTTADTVSLHVRRGDYTLAAEGNVALPLSYYMEAIAFFKARLNNPTFFVFSDDIAWIRANLPSSVQAVFVDHNDQSSPHEDLRLMATCEHHIIANSTLSWWGAWLNAKPGKQVVAPRFWYLTPDTYYPTLFPPDWHALAF